MILDRRRKPQNSRNSRNSAYLYFGMLKGLFLRFLILGQAFCHLTDDSEGSELLTGGCRYEAFKFKFRNDDCDKLRFDRFKAFNLMQTFSDLQSMSMSKILIPNSK